MKTIIIILFATFTSVAQSITNLEYNFKDQNGFECKATLLQNGTETIFLINDTRVGKNHQSVVNPELKYKVYNDKWSKVFYASALKTITRFPIYDKEQVYFSNEIKPKISFTSNKKKIGTFNCQEAIVEKGGRKYSVFFTKDSPAMGPMGFNFLPGLVVELRDMSDIYNKISLLKITKEKSNKTFDEYKKFILSKKPVSYKDYSNAITKLLTNKKRENYAILAQNGASIEYAEDESFFTDHIIDIPDGLITELKKIKE